MASPATDMAKKGLNGEEMLKKLFLSYSGQKEICERRDVNYPQIFQIFSVYELKRDAIAPDN